MPIRCGSAEVLWKEDATARVTEGKLELVCRRKIVRRNRLFGDPQVRFTAEVTRLVDDLGAGYIVYESSKWGYGKLGEYVIGEVSFYRANGV